MSRGYPQKHLFFAPVGVSRLIFWGASQKNSPPATPLAAPAATHSVCGLSEALPHGDDIQMHRSRNVVGLREGIDVMLGSILYDPAEHAI